MHFSSATDGDLSPLLGDAMAKARVGTVPIAATLIAVACSDATSPPSITLSDLEGSWQAARYEFTSLSDPSHKVDLVAQGTSIEFDIDTNGRFIRISVFPPGAPPVTDAGSIGLDGSRLVMTFDVEPDVELRFDVTLFDDLLTLSAAEVESDLGSGPELASLLIAFVRR